MEQLTVQTPNELIALGIEKGLDVTSLEKLMDLKQRYDADLARKAFFRAFTDFQSKCPDLRKTKEVSFGNTKYNYAPLADITRQIAPILQKNDLSYRWEIQDDKQIKVTCLISHIDGHTESTTMTADPDTSGAKNAIQARGSAIEYLKRYTLIGALGISTADSDIDGRLPNVDIDKMHQDFIEVYNQVIQIDSNLSKYAVENWKVEPSPKAYLKATTELRKVLFELKKKA